VTPGAPARGSVVDLDDGRSLGYAEYGEPTGTPIVYLHGLPGSRLDPTPLDDDYRRLNVRVIAIERPGYGLSTPRRQWGILDWPVDIAAAADRLEIERFALIGYSSGGKYAAACAYALPDRVTGTAIVSGVGPPSTTDFRKGLNRTDRVTMTLGRRARPLALAYWRVVRWLVDSRPETFLGEFEKELSDSDKEVLSDPEFRQLVVATSREALRGGAGGIVDDATIQARPWGFELSEISTPVHLWHGDDDEIVHLHHARYAAERIPDARLTILEGVGHFVGPRFADIAEALLR
jgi:pimeloyl-ACP methyl ester carboxylesterase